ncbi:MAG: hypothetical protein GY863_08135, partial [bacterium]|nr:hypothetical protein [bacterium]
MKLFSSKRPPLIARWLLTGMIDNNVIYSASGDVEEGYNSVFIKWGRIAAFFWFWMQVLLCLPKYLRNSTYWSMIMFKNYLKITLRNIK